MATPIQTSRELMAHSPHNPSLLESCFLCSCPSRLVLYNGRYVQLLWRKKQHWRVHGIVLNRLHNSRAR